MPAVIPLLTRVALELGGSKAPANLMQDLGVVEVDSSLSIPDMFTIEIHDPQNRWVQDALLHVGQEVKVGTISSEEEGGPSSLVVGEIHDHGSTLSPAIMRR